MAEMPINAVAEVNPYMSPASVLRSRKWPLRYIAYSVAGIAAAGAVGIAAWLICAAYYALEAENHLIAMSLTLETVEQFVQDTGDWPRSWDDLERVQLRSGHSISPQNLDQIRSGVEVDFTLNLDSVNTAEPNAFGAIRPKPPCFDAYEWRIKSLLQTIAARNAKRKPE